jgi:hypothetical protein
MTKRMPGDVRERVAQTILSRAESVGWDDLNSRERSALYTAWTTDPSIGGVISQYLPREAIRVWIKDGPMKEYARARRGLGPYAALVPTSTERENDITARLLGEGWALVPGSIGVKPARFVVRDEEDNEVDVLWGSPSDLKHLVWAWLNQGADRDSRIVLVTSPSQPQTRDERHHVAKIGKKLATTITTLD